MIKGIGIDIIEIERIKAAVERYGDDFLKKIFTARELKYCRSRKTFKYPELAVRFAAKEAYSKAIGTGIAGFGRKRDGINWQDIEVVNEANGKPRLAIKNKISDKVHASLSHSKDYAVASVYVEK
ncbi:MAG: holo-ACP synthase [Candidatus Margulisbacteria bacterium]|nr:holo-ACP synthase [Candidatus Margulisiibacteriota bacterium]